MEQYNWNSTQVEQGTAERAVEQVRKASRRAGSMLRSSAYTVCLVAIILLEILRRFVVGSINNEFAIDYVFAALIASLGSMLTFYIFFPQGKSDCRAKPVFQDAFNLMQSAINAIVEHALRVEFRLYCRRKAQDEAEDIQEDRLATLEDVGISRADFEEKWKRVSGKTLKKAVKDGELTAEAKRQILVCRKPVEVLPYRPLYFTAGADEKKQNKYLHGSSHHEMWALIKKPISVVVIAIVQSTFTISVSGAENAFEVFLAIVMSVFQVCLSAFMGYFSGHGVSEKDAEVNLAKAGFMLDFLEEQGVKVETKQSDRK